MIIHILLKYLNTTPPKQTLIVKILKINITKEIFILSFKELKLSKILPRKNILEYTFKYSIGYEYNSSKSKMKVIKQILISDKYGNQTYRYKCELLSCGHINTLYQTEATKVYVCPVCNNHIIVKGINDISITHSYLVPYFNYGISHKNIKH